MTTEQTEEWTGSKKAKVQQASRCCPWGIAPKCYPEKVRKHRRLRLKAQDQRVESGRTLTIEEW
ncbi:MAG TPA: hypothetical protein VIO61_04030 [Anaerolineaceae bacterium]